MVKKKGEKPKREPTKHQLSRWQQKKKRQRLFLILGISVIAVVSGVIGGGWYTNEYRPLQETVIRVNGTEFNMGYYVDMLEVYWQGQSPLPVSPDDPMQPLYLQSLANQVETFIQQSELIKQGASDLGIVVSNSEVDEELKRPDPPLSKDYRDIVRTDMLVQRLLDEHFEEEVPVSAEQRHVVAMFLESESQAKEVIGRLEGGEDFGELAGELSLDSLSQAENGDLGWHPRGILSEALGITIPEDYAFAGEVEVLSQPLYDETRTKSVGYWLVKLLGRDEDEQGELFNVQVMLLGSEQEAQDVIAKLESGEDFAALVEELSQHGASKEDGGDLGWLAPEEIYEPLKDFILGAEMGTVSEPIRDEEVATKGGYWLVKVLDKEDSRLVSDDDRAFLKAKALDEWIASLWDNPENEVESYLDDEKRTWAIERIMGS